MYFVFLLLGVAAAAPVAAADILGARYDPAADALVVDIAYRGTNPDHEFSVQWGSCSEASPPRAVGRLIDRQGTDPARGDYRVRERVALTELACRGYRDPVHHEERFMILAP